MDPRDPTRRAPSAIYPYPGNNSYLFAGAFWIGAIVGRDTLVSVGADGWGFVQEMYPDPYPKGDVIPGGKVIDLLRNCPNLFADLSAGSAYNALTRDASFGRDFVIEFHDRLLFARDDFTNRMQELLTDYNLPRNVYNNVMYKNSQNILNKR